MKNNKNKVGVFKITFLNNLKGKVGNLAQTAAQKSSQMMEITKLNINIKTEKDGIVSLYQQLGEYCFQKCKDSENEDQEINKICEKVKIHLENIDFFEAKIDEIKKMVICPACGQKVLKTNKYCGKCGVELGSGEGQTE